MIDGWISGDDGGGGFIGQTADDFGAEIGEGGLAWIAGDFYVAEAFKGELRCELFFALAAEDEDVGGVGVAQVLGVDAVVGIDDFGEAQFDARAGGAVRFEDCIAGHILAHVEDVDAC